jgi:hypothetical protein
MPEPVRVQIEVGKKKRSVASAFDWPGWDRWAKTADGALGVLETYRPRYAKVAELAGYGDMFAAAGPLEVVERVPGTGMTDFYGTPCVAAPPEYERMTPADLERKTALLQACWTYFDSVADRVNELRLGPRGGGRDRDRLRRHANGAEIDEWAPKVDVKVPLETRDDPVALQTYRNQFIAAIREYGAAGEPARNWQVPFLIRRACYHMLDHAWEMEDRDLSA